MAVVLVKCDYLCWKQLKMVSCSLSQPWFLAPYEWFDTGQNPSVKSLSILWSAIQNKESSLILLSCSFYIPYSGRLVYLFFLKFTIKEVKVMIDNLQNFYIYKKNFLSGRWSPFGNLSWPCMYSFPFGWFGEDFTWKWIIPLAFGMFYFRF